MVQRGIEAHSDRKIADCIVRVAEVSEGCTTQEIGPEPASDQVDENEKR
jgi:hypothetical protein